MHIHRVSLIHNNVAHRFFDIAMLLLCMYVSEILLGNPIFGAAIRMTMHVWTIFVRLRLINPNIRTRTKTKFLLGIMFLLIIAANVILIYLSPAVTGQSRALWLVIFIILTSLHVLATDLIAYSEANKNLGYTAALISIHLTFFIVVSVLAFLIISSTKDIAVVLSFYGALTFSMIIAHKNKKVADTSIDLSPLQKIHSYAVFSKMAYYTYTAFFFSLMMYICYMAFMPEIRGISIYAVIVLWIVLVYVVAYICYKKIIRSKKAMQLGIFGMGATLWIFSSIMLYRSEKSLAVTLWSIFWAFGLAVMYAVLSRLSNDMKLVAQLDDEIPAATREQIHFSNTVFSYIAFSAAGIIMTFILTFWNFFIVLKNDLWIKLFRTSLVLLPMFFILLAVGFALRQPLDEQNRQRLMQLMNGDSSKSQKARLRYLLVSKYYKRFGVKIIMALLRPIWHHKTYGKENIVSGDFPSIFVCNHGLIYGPVTAILYMPVYFRPWINSQLLEKEQAIKNMYTKTFSRFKWLPAKTQRWLASVLAKPLCWALSSYEPIPVYRNSGREILSTLNDTVEAMVENDNILIFPENPRKNETGLYSTDGVGEFYTGFAHIAKMYYSKTGKCVSFYPVYANKSKRTFTIGKPVKYNNENHPRVERARLAERLKKSMNEMKEKAESD